MYPNRETQFSTPISLLLAVNFLESFENLAPVITMCYFVNSYEHRRSHESISKIMQEESMAYIAVRF